MTIHPVGAESFHANGRTDGQTEMTKLIVAFRNFAKSPNIKLRFKNVKIRNIINFVIRC